MKHLLETLKSARWLEIMLIAVLVCALAVIALDGEKGKLTEEEKMERMLSGVKGAGKVRVMLGGEDQGAVILAEGADDIGVMLSLQRTTHVLTGLPIERIEVIKSE